MKPNLFLLLLVGVIISGCATTQPTDVSKLQIKVAQLERKLNEKDQEINDLKHEIKEISLQPEQPNSYSYPEYDEIEEPQTPAAKTISYNAYMDKELKDIIRVPVSATEVQKALKNAGYYNGNLDGKIGGQSRKAIKEFQKDHDLASDGVIGKKTWSELKTYLD